MVIVYWLASCVVCVYGEALQSVCLDVALVSLLSPSPLMSPFVAPWVAVMGQGRSQYGDSPGWSCQVFWCVPFVVGMCVLALMALAISSWSANPVWLLQG